MAQTGHFGLPSWWWEIVRQHLEWFSGEHGVRHTADLNQSWEMNRGGTKTIGIELNETIKVSEDIRISQATIQLRQGDRRLVR